MTTLCCRATRPAQGAGEADVGQPLQPASAWLDNLHRELDAAVAAAYGWPADLPDERRWRMRLTYDPRHNIAYIRLRERQGEVDTVRVSDELNIDLAPDGTVYGIEFLNANEQLKASDGGRLVVVDEAGGAGRELALA